MPPKKNILSLEIRSPGGAAQELDLDAASVIVGSGPDATVRVVDPLVSPVHVMFKVGGAGGVTAIDLGSENGTRVGERPLQEPTPIKSGDVVRVGGSTVRVRFGESRAPRLLHAVPSGGAAPDASARVLQVSVHWGEQLLAVEQIPDGAPVTIGAAADARFHVFDEGVGARLELAQPKGAAAQVRIPRTATVVLTSAGAHRSRAQLTAEGRLSAVGPDGTSSFTLALSERLLVSFDRVTFVLQFVRPSARAAVARNEDADYRFFAVTAVSLLTAAAFVAAMLLVPPLDRDPSDDLFRNPSKYVKLLVKPEKKVELKKQLSGIEEGARAREKEGKFGKPEARRAEADPSKKGGKREVDRRKVLSAGLLSALGGSTGAASSIFGPGGLGTGINNALGGLKGGAGLGDAHGVGGLGARGTGTGGGGTGLGLGGLGTKGGGRGAGGSGLIDLGGRGKSTTQIIPGKTTVIGGLSKDVIAKVVRSHQSEIKFCYEQELQKRPELAGKVAIIFTIDPAGTVSDANVAESTLGNDPAERCMVGRIMRWRFPEPEGGGVVTVTYPWIFRPAGAAE